VLLEHVVVGGVIGHAHNVRLSCDEASPGQRREASPGQRREAAGLQGEALRLATTEEAASTGQEAVLRRGVSVPV
jgi:hypothetical protein